MNPPQEALSRKVEQKERFNPFPGLRPFESDEDHLFFGRDREADELLRRLRTNRFVSVLGTSGSGKSSLVRSGLIPSLYSGSMVKAGSTWRVAVFRPGDDPIGNLAAALDQPGVLRPVDEEMAPTSRMLLETTLRRSTLGLADCVRHAHLPRHENVLVVVDQFEELFRFKETRRMHDSRDEAVAFAKLLLEAAGQEDVPVYVVITMRSDFVGDCMEYPGLPEAINEGQYLIPRMTRDELRAAITGPVAVAGGAYAPRLVARLLNDVGDDPDQLPVLQHALMRTWDAWEWDEEEGNGLDLRHYEAIGTMAEALSRHAEEAHAELGRDDQRLIAEHLFKALTDTRIDDRGVRRPTAVEEVATITGRSEADVIQVVDVFRRPGRSFLMPPQSVALTGGSIIDLSHESLMRLWRRLVTWVGEEQASGKAFRRLCRAAERYEQGQASLWVEPELSLGLKWREENRPTEAWGSRYTHTFDKAIRFLDESKAAHDRTIEEAERERRAKLLRARLLAGVLGAAAVVTFFFGYFAYRAGQIAEKEARTAQAVSGFLVDLFGVVDPEEALGETITAREILDEGARKIDSTLAEEPAVQAKLLATIGTVYGSLGLYDEAQPLLDRAVSTAQASVGADDPVTLEASDRLAELKLDRGRFQQAQDLYSQVVAARRRVLGDEHPDTLASLSGLAEAYREQGRHGDAEEAAREAYEAQRRVLGDDHEDTLTSMNELGVTLVARGRYKEAEPILLGALETRQRTLGTDHPDTLASMEGLGGLYIQLGRYDEAETLYRRNLEDHRRIFGEDHPKTYSALNYLGELDVQRSRWIDAEAKQTEVLEGRRRVLGDDHPSTLASMGQLAWTYRAQSHNDKAEETVVAAHEKAKEILGEEHAKTLELANIRAATNMSLGRNDVAEKLFARNLEIYVDLYGEAHPDTLVARNNLAVAYANWGQRDKSEELDRENVRLATEAFGEDNPSTLFYLNNLLGGLTIQRRFEEAEQLGKKLLETHRRVLGDDHPETFRTMQNLADVYNSQQRRAEAEPLFREALEGRTRVLGEDHPDTLGSRTSLLWLTNQLGKHEEAYQMGVALLADVERILGEENPRTLGGYGGLGWIAAQAGKRDAQLELWTKALAIRKRMAEREGSSAKERIDYAAALVDSLPALQNPPEAVKFARQANEMTGWENRRYISTLAEAHAKDGKTGQAVEAFRKALALVPEDDTRARNGIEARIAAILEASGDVSQKRKMATDRLARRKDEAGKPGASPRTVNDYAWNLLTVDPPDLRDPREALAVAKELNDATGQSDPDILATLALAYHLAGEKDLAIETQKKVLEIIPPDAPWARPTNENRLTVYSSGGRSDSLDLAKVLPGVWSGKVGPLDARIELTRNGDTITCTNRLELPFMPADVEFCRMDVRSGRLELRGADSGWTNLRWIPADWILTDEGELISWGLDDWSPLRFVKE